MNRTLQPLFDLLVPLLLAVAILVLVGMLATDTEPELISGWLNRESGAVWNWWLLTTLAGAAVFPLLYRLMPSLPSRGYALARSAGLMLTGFIFWFLASLGFLTNDTGSMIFAWVVVLTLSIVAWTRRTDPENLGMGDWFKQQWALVLTVEIVFVAMLFIWAGYRAHEPEIRSTEKPMEMMFINSIRQSESFPPNDAWLAGYSISYYYFGYVITAALADLSGVNSGIAFGLIGPLLFALSGIGILGVVYDLVRARRFPTSETLLQRGSQASGLLAGLLGVFLLVIMGNLAPFFIELPYNNAAPQIADMNYFEFWDVPERSDLVIQRDGVWVDSNGDAISLAANQRPKDAGYGVVRDTNANGEPDFSEDSFERRDFTEWGFWWWFRYSRVVNDRFLPRTVIDPATEEETVIEGRPIGVQPIDEFPHFSFVLTDIHPHVLALPFTLLAIGLTLGLALRQDKLEWWGYFLLAIWVGGMIFMNSWDAVFLPFLFGGEALRRLLKNGRLTLHDWGQVGLFALIILALTVLFYFPWILSFTSQASGFYLNIIWPTQPQQLFLQFGAFFLLLMPFVVREIVIGRARINWPAALITFGLLFIFIGVLLPFVGAAINLGACDEAANPRPKACEVRDIVLGGATPDNSETFWSDLFARRAGSYLSEGLILLAIVLIGFRLFARDEKSTDSPENFVPPFPAYTPSTAAALLILAAGLVLILAPDFIYLVDNFSVRINTVFKLYYQGWIFLSVAAAYGVYAILADVKLPVTENPTAPTPMGIVGQAAFAALLVAVMGMSAVYPLYAARTRGLQETGRYAAQQAYEACQDDENNTSTCTPPPALTLDGRAGSVSRDEYAVITCLMALNPAPGTVIAEAPFEGGYQPEYGRVAMLTGIPNLLGWQNHQRQWRGTSYDQVTDTVLDANGGVVDSRPIQLDRLYQSDNWEIAQGVIDRYGIDFVMVGQAERTRYADYPFGLEKFADYATPVCPSESATLYKVN